jgi:general secretion pathway protein H
VIFGFLSINSTMIQHRSLITARQSGFTLIELLVVITIIALSYAVVILSLRPSADQRTAQNAEQLAAVLDTARAQARSQSAAVLWRCDASGITTQGATPLSPEAIHHDWQNPFSVCDPNSGVFGPDPLISNQSIQVYTSISAQETLQPEQSLDKENFSPPIQIVTNGLSPFKLSTAQDELP